MSLQVTFIPKPLENGGEGLRSRKKARNRAAIQNAALRLFADQGYDETSVEEIAFRADVSVSTFFRNFASKSDILLSDENVRLPELCVAILAQPAVVRDLEAVRRALLTEWVPHIDPDRTVLTEKAVSKSTFLRGLGYRVGQEWHGTVAETLVIRRGDPSMLEECRLIARTALGVFGSATMRWAFGGGSQDFATLLDEGFEMIDRMCRPLNDESSRREL